MPTLDGMTQERWSAMSDRQRAGLRDNSDLHPKLMGLEGKLVRVAPKRAYGRSVFRVGITTGWRPAHLAVSASARGSSDVIRPSEHFDAVTVLEVR